MMKHYQAKYYNGKTSASVDVEVSVSKRGIHFEHIQEDSGELFSYDWDHTDTKKYEKQHISIMYVEEREGVLCSQVNKAKDDR